MPYGMTGNPTKQEIGVITGSYAAARLPDEPCWKVMFRAYSTNAGSFFLGTMSPGLHWEIDAGESTEWIDINNLNELWHGLSSGTSDYLAFWLQG